MDSESDTSSWFANLCERLYTFCSETDDSITQDPVEFLRDQFHATCESFKQLCLYEPDLEEEDDEEEEVEEDDEEEEEEEEEEDEQEEEEEEEEETSTEQEENTDFLSDKLLNINNFSSKEEGKGEEDKDFDGLSVEEVACDAHANLSTSVGSLEVDSSEKKEEISEFAAEVGDNKSLDNEVVSSAGAWPTYASQPYGCNVDDLMDNADISDPALYYVTKLNVGFIQPSGQQNIPDESESLDESQKLDESLIIVDADELRLYIDLQDRLHYQKTKGKKKLAKKPSCGGVEVIEDDDWEIVSLEGN